MLTFLHLPPDADIQVLSKYVSQWDVYCM